MSRTYNTLGRRILAMLAEGGPRKHTVLVGIARDEARLKSTLERLIAAGSIRKFNHRRGGLHYALAKPKS
jgi:hypothetical protein